MLGYTLPLFIIAGAEAVVGALLLCPKPLNQPAISLARLTHTQIGATIFHTLAGVLVLLMASPIYDGIQLYNSTKEKPEQAALDLSEHEARTLLSATLTASCLVMMFFVRKLGRVLGELDRMSISEAALLKQVKGLQSEYTRMVDSAGGAAAAPAPPAAAGKGGDSAAPSGSQLPTDEVAELRKLVADLEKQNSTLQARVDRVNKEHAQAESNLAALKTQAKGLENEYDRLLAEHDELKRQLQCAGVGAGAGSGAADPRMAKKDE